MAKTYQVVHMKNMPSLSTGEANEHQRRFTEKMWENRLNRKKNAIDRTRNKCNFEILRGGKLVPLGSEKTIKQRIDERYKETGVRDPNVVRMENYKAKGKVFTGNPYRTICEIIFSGNADKMRQLAFGEQKLDRTKGVDNSHLVLRPEIKEWAKDIYSAVAKKYGEENIVSFVVHCDESSPHVHCCILPIYYDEKKGHNRVMYRDTFGGDGDVLESLHNYISGINQKWGLERGESVSVTHNRHVPREEYYAQLGHQIQQKLDEKAQLKKSMKGLNTMINNLTKQRDECAAELDELERQIATGNGNRSELEQKVAALRERLYGLDEKITDKRTKLMEADRKLHDIQQRVQDAQTKAESMEYANAIVRKELDKDVLSLFKTNFFDNAVADVKKLLEANPNMELDGDMEVLKDLAYSGAEHVNEVMELTKDVFIKCIDGATNIQESGGGGGSTSNLPWRDKDEDLDDYLRRCLLFASKAVHARYNKPKYGSGSRKR